MPTDGSRRARRGARPSDGGQANGTKVVDPRDVRSLDARPAPDIVHSRSPMTSDRRIGVGKLSSGATPSGPGSPDTPAPVPVPGSVGSGTGFPGPPVGTSTWLGWTMRPRSVMVAPSTSTV